MSRELLSHGIKIGEPLGNPPRRSVQVELWLQRDKYTLEELGLLINELTEVRACAATLERSFMARGGSR